MAMYPREVGSLRRQVFRGSIGSLFVNATRAGLAFLVAVVLARLLGPDEYGVYSFSFALLMLVAVPSQIGVPQLIVRETAKAHVIEKWGLINGLWRWGRGAVVTLSLIGFGCALVGGFMFAFLAERPGRIETLVIGSPLIPLIALIAVYGACLRGLKKVVFGQLPDGVLRPIIFVVIISSSLFFTSTEDFNTAEWAMVAHVLASLLALIFSLILLRRFKPKELINNEDMVFDSAQWRRAVVPLAMITGLHLLNNYTDLIVLGIFRTDEEVGVYRAVFQFSLLVTFGLQAINQVLHPHFARLYKSGEMAKLQKLVTASARVILAFGVLVAIVLTIFGSHLMALLFGPAFNVGNIALIILVVGQLASAGFGSVGALLNMTGHERDTVRGLSIAIVVNIALNFILIPFWGMEGAAVATTSTLIVWNFILRKSVKKRLSIESSVFGSRNRKTL